MEREVSLRLSSKGEAARLENVGRGRISITAVCMNIGILQCLVEVDSK